LLLLLLLVVYARVLVGVMLLLLLLLVVVVCAGGLVLLLLLLLLLLMMLLLLLVLVVPLLMIGPIRLSWYRLAIRRGEAWGTSKNEKKKPKLNLHDECCSYHYPRHTTAYYYLVAAGCGRTLVSSFVDRSAVICRSVLLSSARLRVKCKSAKFTVYCECTTLQKYAYFCLLPTWRCEAECISQQRHGDFVLILFDAFLDCIGL